jgi:Zn-dependent peptidase ImmA (M78 family)
MFVAPKVLLWARDSLNLPRAAVVRRFEKASKSQFNLTLQRLEKLETEGEMIRLTLLKEFARLYKRPLAVFFLKEPPREDPKPIDRRTLPSDRSAELTPETILVIRRARRVQAIAGELLSQETGPLGASTQQDNPEDIALDWRETLGLTFEKQKGLKDPRELFEYLRQSIESLGLVVVKAVFPIGDARALSLADRIPYVIVVNNKDGRGLVYQPKVFSIMHEFAHILLREGAICNDFVRSSKATEIFCNHFAATFLVPTDDLKEEIARLGSPITSDIDGHVDRLRKHFKTSREVILRRLLTLRLVDGELYEAKTREWDEQFEEWAKTRKKSAGILTPAEKALNEQGRAFVDLVLTAMREERLTQDTAADYLGIKSKHLGDLMGLAKLA